jgi:hypothetical protein
MIILFSACNTSNQPTFKDASATIENRVNDLLKQMTLKEKVTQTYGLAAELYTLFNI